MSNYIFIFFVSAILSPLALHELLEVYSEGIPDVIGYKYWKYSFSLISLSVILVGFAINFKYFSRFLKFIILPLILYNFVIGVLNGSSIYTEFHYHGLLILLTGIGYSAISDFLIKSLTFHRFLTLLYYVLFPTQIVRLLLNQSTDGRFAMQGLGLGETALFTSLTILYLMFKPSKNNNDNILLITACFSLLLTGQRSVMAMLVAFMLIRYLGAIVDLCIGRNSKIGLVKFVKNQNMLILLGIITFTSLSLIYLTIFDFKSVNFIHRLMTTIYSQSESVQSTSTSVGGRLLSLLVGVQLIFDFPFGVGTDFYQLQLRMQERGYPTFPHNGLMSIYLMMSPVFMFAVIVAVMRHARFLRKSGFLLGSIPYFCLFSWSFWGGPFLNPLLVWIFLFFLTSNLIGKENYAKCNH